LVEKGGEEAMLRDQPYGCVVSSLKPLLKRRLGPRQPEGVAASSVALVSCGRADVRAVSEESC
jgi:hypothetical protein